MLPGLRQVNERPSNASTSSPRQQGQSPYRQMPAPVTPARAGPAAPGSADRSWLPARFIVDPRLILYLEQCHPELEIQRIQWQGLPSLQGGVPGEPPTMPHPHPREGMDYYQSTRFSLSPCPSVECQEPTLEGACCLVSFGAKRTHTCSQGDP